VKSLSQRTRYSQQQFVTTAISVHSKSRGSRNALTSICTRSLPPLTGVPVCASAGAIPPSASAPEALTPQAAMTAKNSRRSILPSRNAFAVSSAKGCSDRCVSMCPDIDDPPVLSATERMTRGAGAHG